MEDMYHLKESKKCNTGKKIMSCSNWKNVINIE